MNVNQLQPNEYHPYFKVYLDQLGEDSLLESLFNGGEETFGFFSAIPEDKLEYRYEEGKWTIKDILLHLIDAERAFCFRALNFAREEDVQLPGFDENIFADNAGANLRTIVDLLDEYTTVRKATLLLFKNFSEIDLVKVGKANNANLSVRAAGFIICSHEIHHIKVIKERYL